jgi:hypothetical protein
MTIYTAHWQLKQWPQGHTRVSISRGSPRWLPAGSYKTYRALAPGKWFNSVSPQEYLDLYNAEILGKLDPRRVVEELEALGPNPTMLCWEGPKGIEAGTHWCHRHHRRAVARGYDRHQGRGSRPSRHAALPLSARSAHRRAELQRTAADRPARSAGDMISPTRARGVFR